MRGFQFLCSAASIVVAMSCAGCGQDAGAKKGAISPAAQKPRGEESYVARRAAFRTALVRKGPSPQPWTEDPLPRGVTRVAYESDGRKLTAWLFVPQLPENEKRPALVYLHGGFAFGADDFDVCGPFVEAGFVVLCPTVRGENGNSGDFQMMLGEVDDAACAVRWLASQKHVDASRIFVFGHSSGGVMSAMLSLYEDLPVVHTGSAGGLYGEDLFDATSSMVPFDLTNPQERQIRVLVGNLRWMKRPHFAFAGRQDTLMKSEIARREAAGARAPLTVIDLPGDHHSSLDAAVRGYLEIVQRNK